MKQPALKKDKALTITLSAALFAALVSPPVPAEGATLSCQGSLLFGEFTLSCAGPGEATVTPGNILSVSGCITSSGAPSSRAQCNINQTGSQTNFQISVTAPGYQISNGGGQQMLVDDFTCYFQGTIKPSTTGPCVWTTSGWFLFMDIGATLNVNTNQAAGSYSGTFTVNANFP